MSGFLSRSFYRKSMLLLSLLITGGAFLYNIYVLSALFVVFALLYMGASDIAMFNQRYSKIYWLFVVLAFFAVYHTILNDHFSMSIIIRAINLIFASFLLICYFGGDPEKDFISDYIVIGKIISVHALVSTLLFASFPQMFSVMPEHESVYQSLGILFSCRPAPANVFFWPHRCMGLFWEPGVLQFFVNLFLYILLFQTEEKKANRRWIVVSVLVILMTQSITGIYLLACIFLFYLIHRKKVVWLVVISFAAAPIVIDMFYQKFLSDWSGDAGSYWMRLADTLSALQIIRDHPFLGIGFDNDDFVMLRRGVEYQGVLDADYFWDRGNTNSVLTLFYGLGVPLGLYLFIKLYKQQIFSKQRLLFFIIIVISCVSEPLLLMAFPLFFIFSGMIPRSEVDPAEPALPENDNPEVS